MLQIGNRAPDFTLTLADESQTRLADYQGQYVLLYFFPRADTPGCTTQAKELSKDLAKYAKAKCAVLGVSADSPAKQAKFQAKYNIGFALGCDEEHKVCEAYGVWQEKSLYGRKFWGVVRSSFLIAPDGTLAQIWHKVKPATHSADVLAELSKI